MYKTKQRIKICKKCNVEFIIPKGIYGSYISKYCDSCKNIIIEEKKKHKILEIKNKHNKVLSMKFGKLNPINFIRKSIYPSVDIYKCECDCGNFIEVPITSLRSGRTKSCGCYNDEIRSFNSKKYTSLPKGESAFNEILYNYKYAAQKRNHSFLLTRDEFKKMINENCHYCNSKPSNVKKHPSLRSNYVYQGIDRKDSNVGYIIENCVPCCEKCNKNKGTIPYLKYLQIIKKDYDT